VVLASVGEPVTADRWLAGRALSVLAGTGLVLLLLIGGVDTIERSRLLRDGGEWFDLALLVAWRIPALGRELVPVWTALSAALLVGWMVRSGAWEALQGAGVAELRSLGVVLLVVGGVGGGVAGAIELLVPVASNQAAAAESRLSGHGARLAGGWVRLADIAFRVGAVDGDALLDVTVLGSHQGHLRRLDADRVRWDGTAWVGLIRGQRADGVPVQAVTLPLPPPRQVEALVRPRATAEAGLAVLRDIPLPRARGWFHRRLAGLLAPGIVVLIALGVSRRRRPGLAASVAVSTVAAGSLHLLVAVVAEAGGPVGVWGAWGIVATLGAFYLVSST
jgi:lipopolysaccharide export LptBFGC system permease protein LptF